MAVLQAQSNHNLQIHHLPQSQYIDAVRWLPPLSPFHKHLVLSLYDPDSLSSTLEIHSLGHSHANHQQPFLSPLSSIPLPSRPSSLSSPSPSLLSLSTLSGSLHFYSLDPEFSPISSVSVEGREFHVGPINGADVVERECVTVGEDGRVNVVSLTGSSAEYRRVFDGDGLVAYTAAKWASPVEFATGGLGFGLQWWDQRRRAGEPALQFKGGWPQKNSSGIVHSVDIHPSRKHTCLAGGSSGTVFAWDLRWPQQPIVLSGVGIGERAMSPVSESDVWKVQFDCHLQSSTMANVSSSRMLPVMMCSEDGILAVLEQGNEPVELLAEPCAINSFDIDKQNHNDIVCSLEWESLAIISRP